MAQDWFDSATSSSPPAQAGGGIIVRNPWKAKEEARKDEDQAFERERIDIARDANARQAESTAATIANMNKPPVGYRWGPPDAQGNPTMQIIPGGPADTASQNALTSAQRIELETKRGTLRNLQSGIAALRKQYEDNFKGRGASEYLPAIARPANGVFNDTSGSLSAYVAAALGLSGQQFNTPAEQQLFIGSILPKAGDTDQQIENKLNRLDELMSNADQASASLLGVKPGQFSAPPPPPTAGGNGGGSPGPYQNDPSGNRTFLTERDKAFAAEAQAAFRDGADRAAMDTIAQKYGAQPFGEDLDRAIESRRAGNASIQFAPTPTGFEEAGLTGAIMGPWANSGPGSYAIGAGNALTAGQLGNIAELTGSSEGGTDVAMGMAQDNAAPYFLGGLTGGALATAATGAGLGAGSRMVANPTVANLLANPMTADAIYGAASGASQSDDPLYGAIGGTATALGGSYLGSKAGGLVGGSRIEDPLNKGERAVINAMDRGTGISVEEALQQGQDLGLPMTLADVSPEVAALAGSAIRRNPTVAGQVRDMLARRSQGQIDRFRGAVARDLGPLDNVPQRADDLIERARTAAGPLYEEAYAAPVVNTPTLDELLATPFGQQGLSRAKTIAANERRNPQGMGLALDANGDIVLNPIPHDQLGRIGQAEANAFAAEEALKRARAAQLTGGTGGQTVAEAQAAYDLAKSDIASAYGALSDAPTVSTAATSPGYTTQTLDYVKRGMDDALEQHRNQITGKLELDEAGKAENSVLRALLQEMDTLNPAYGKARAAYAGPAAEREALLQGRSALTENPDLLAVQAGRQTPERLELMQLGARDRLVQGAEGLSKSTNPFRILNTPATERRLSVLYPEQGDDVARLLLQRDLENKMAGTSNFLAGNSATAERAIADQAFADEGLLRPILEGGVETAITGAPVATLLRSGVGKRAVDMFRLGSGKRAMERAEQIAPIALNPDPADTVAQILEMQARQTDYQAAVQAAKEIASRRGGVGGTAATTATYPYWMGD